MRFALLLSFALLFGCTTADDAPGYDPPAEPETVSFEGTWNVQAFPMEGDSALVAITMNATDTPDGWSTVFDHLEDPVPASSVVIDGDSATVVTGLYSSALREGAMVSTTSVLYVAGDEMAGHFTATYEEGEPAVLEGRFTGSRSN